MGEMTTVSARLYEYTAVIEAASQPGGAYVRFPWDARAEFGRGRVRVEATFDGVRYTGSLVNMGVRNDDGSPCHIIGIRKDIRTSIHKTIGDSVRVTIRALEPCE